MTENKSAEEILNLIYKDKRWHTWKCRCGCLNGRYNGNCGRCHGMVNTDAMFCGHDDFVAHGGIWKPEILIDKL